MELNMSWSLFFWVTLIYYGTLIFYRIYLHPLARFPGPRLAAISRWYEAYYDVILDGKFTIKISKLHKVYGPIVRISPHELHVADALFFDKIYRTDGRWHKYSWAYDAFGAKHSTLFGSDHDAHRARRRAIAPFFSRSNVNSRQELIRQTSDKICRRISELAGTTMNLGASISAFTRDTGNRYIIGKDYNELDEPDFAIGLSVVSQGAGVFWRTTKHVRWFGPALRAMPISWVMKTADEGTKAFLRRLQRSEENTRYAIAAANTSLSHDSKMDTNMVDAILKSDLPAADKTFNRVFEEVATVTGAAFETTANTLRLILFHVFSNDEILRRLRQDIATLPNEASEPMSLEHLERLPYLTAILMEGMRLSPAVASRAARITDKDIFYGKWRIPAGTPVGMTTILMHTDETLYPQPMRFDPDRWMDPVVRAALARTYAPFSQGTRICLGMYLAWTEMYFVVATLAKRFTFTVEDATASDFEMVRDNFGIGTRAGCNLMVNVVPYGT